MPAFPAVRRRAGRARTATLLAALAGLALIAAATRADAGIHPLWNKYLTLYQERQAERPAKPDAHAFPGRITGTWSEQPRDLFRTAWPHRSGSYELLCPNTRLLARLVYGLALHTRDLQTTVTLQRFERGAQGFHYDAAQVAAWANDLLNGQAALNAGEELLFLGWLVQDGVLRIEDGRLEPAGRVGHVLGAAPGPSRSLERNLAHERLHVLWDEDPAFRTTNINAWETLSEDEKQGVYAELTGYDRSDAQQVIEEWAVRRHDPAPPWR
jgi:hypothetical protein